MIDSKVMETTKSILKGFGNTYFSDKGTLKRNKVIEDLDAYTPMLMKALLANQLIHDTYTESIVIDDKSVELFKLNQFIEMFTYKEYWQDSYTKFENKIGLTAGGKFIDETADVVLDFPFKDSVLKAGMTKEDQKDIDEPFLHETIAKAEIDQLLEPKIFVNATKYDQENLAGASTDSFNDDNLIIKGNNLITLHSIVKKYKSKVKTIFMDPPYNTGNDGFNYNDHFSHSAWLTFMKNRLSIARDLLNDNGSIWITLDSMEIHYFKILCDAVFGRDNFVSEVIWINNKQSKGYADKISMHHNTILIYRKSEQFSLNLLPRTEEDNKNYKNPDNDKNGAWRPSDVRNSLFRPNLQYKIKTPSGNIISNPDNGWRFSKETFERELSEGKIKFSDDETRIIRKIYLKDQEGRVVESVWDTLQAGTTRDANSEIKSLFGNSIFLTPKPEKLLSRIISIGSNENDIVLDFFMGSATTQAVAMKMNRRFIGIEQMDYIKTVSVERLKKVIAGEQGGISKDVNWQGGGSFVYAELMEKNQGYLKDVQQAETTKQLEDVVHRMIEGGADFDFRVDVEKVLQDPEYQSMSLADKKQLIVKVIDKNQLYYAYSDMDDRDVQELMSDSDIAFNKSFYGERDL